MHSNPAPATNSVRLAHGILSAHPLMMRRDPGSEIKTMDAAHKRFVIAATYRTGSSAIAEAITAHPAIACGWEWTMHIPVWQKIRVARNALNGDLSGLSRKHRDRMAQILS